MCCDPLCSRMGYSQVNALNVGEEIMETSLLFMDPKLYCSRKHAISTKVVTRIQNNQAPPSVVNAEVDCDMPMGNTMNELHNTYPYSPVFADDMWFHTMFHAVAYYLVCSKDEELANEIRQTIDVTMLSYHLLDAEDAEDEDQSLKVLSSKMQELIYTKFLSSERMMLIVLYYGNTKINYSNCCEGLKDPKALNNLMQSNFKQLMDDLKNFYK